MSANASISEGGKGYTFGQVKCLMVEGDNGEFYPWYPEADRQLDSLSVDKNGIYRASDRGVYGWNRVSVNVAQSDRVTGKDPETGEEKTVTVDPDTGELVETIVPTEIRITTLPTKTEYTHGETIDYSGIVVHAYSSTGQDMGEVPFSELVFPETMADAQKTEGWTDGQGLNAIQVAYTPHWTTYKEWVFPNWVDKERQFYCSGSIFGTSDGFPATLGGGGPATLWVTRYNGVNYAVSLTGSIKADLYVLLDGEENPWGWTDAHGFIQAGSSSTVVPTGRFKDISWGTELTQFPVSTVDPTTVDPANLHATQSLPVQWQDPDSGAVLETSFNITVTGGN